MLLSSFKKYIYLTFISYFLVKNFKSQKNNGCNKIYKKIKIDLDYLNLKADASCITQGHLCIRYIRLS